jgi:hypothetical protein
MVIKKPNQKRRKDNKILSQKTKKVTGKSHFKYLFTNSSHVKFGHHLLLFLLPVCLITPLRIGASAGLRCIYLNHLKRCCTSFSSTGATPSLSRKSSFRTRFLLVCSQIHRSMHISATLSCWTCRLLVDQHYALYNMIDRITVL